jgi:hypothetical protein
MKVGNQASFPLLQCYIMTQDNHEYKIIEYKMTTTKKNGKWWVYSFEKYEDGGTLNTILIVVAHNTKRPWIENDHVIEKNDKRVSNEFFHLKNDNKSNELGFVIVFAIL